eukprot:scaffold82863_cov60-Attheya_sp.AAC.1
MASNNPSVPSYATGNLMPSPSPMLQTPQVFQFFNLTVAPANAPQMHNQSCDVQTELQTVGTAACSTTQKEHSNTPSFVTMRDNGGPNDDIILGDVNGNERLAGFLNILPTDFVENEKEVPPTMQAMKLFLQNDQLGPLHWKADSLEAAIIFTKAYFESQQKSIKSVRREASKYIVGCCHCSSFLIDWRKVSHSTNGMAVDKFVDHNLVCGRTNNGTNTKITNYLFKDLVPVVVPSYVKHRKKGLNMKASFVRDLLSPYISNSDTLTDSTCSKIKRHAENLAFGSIVEQGPLLDQVAALCSKKGHNCILHHVTKNQQASILFDNRKAEHMAVMKHVSKENRIPFKGLLVGETQLLDQFHDNDKILYGWDFAPRWAKRDITMAKFLCR